MTVGKVVTAGDLMVVLNTTWRKELEEGLVGYLEESTHCSFRSRKKYDTSVQSGSHIQDITNR